MRPRDFCKPAVAGAFSFGISLAAAHAVPTIRAQLAANATSQVASTSTVSFNIYLPLHDEAGLDALLAAQQDKTSPQYHTWLSPAQFADRFAPSRDSMQKLAATLRAQGVQVAVQTRSLRVTGDAATVNKLLATQLVQARLPSGHLHTVAARGVALPGPIAAAGGIVLSFSQHPHEAHTFVRNVGEVPANRASTTGTYWYGDLKQAYQYPAYTTKIKTPSGKTQRLDGTGATIALLMSSDALDSDVAHVFAHEHWSDTTGQPAPTIKHIPVNGGCVPDAGEDYCGAFDESSLDVQEAITGAPGATVELYNIPSLSDDDIDAGYTQILEDNTADVVSSSFGGCELFYTAGYNDGVDYTYLLRIEHQLFKQGNAQGITFLASSGDNAGLECVSKSYILDGKDGTFVKGVSTPAVDPNVTAVGGTNVVTKYTAGSLDSTYVRENAYSDPLIAYDPYGIGANVSGGYWGAGGGISTVFDRPGYQSFVNTGSMTKRTVPDIGMQVGGCPGGISVLPCNGGDNPLNGNGNTDRSAVVVGIAGKFYGLIGTSVSSPEFASVVALAVEHYGRLGNINPYLYALGAFQTQTDSNPDLPTTVYHRHIQGFNGYATNRRQGGGYTYTTGNGTPIVYRLVGVPNAETAGVPQTATNP